MPSFQYSPSIDASVFFESAANWTLTSVTATKAIWESGDQKLEVTGSGLSLAGGGAGTIIGVKLYEVDLSSGSAVDKQVMASSPGLSLSFAGLVSAVAESIYGFGGFAFIFGGNDTLTGSAADDYMSGFGGNDSIVGNAGNDYLSGDDELNEFGSTGGRDTLVGGDGNDVLSGGGGNDSMVGGNGNDYYFVTDAGDRVVEATGSAAGSADRVNFTSQSGLLTYTLAANVENLEVSPLSMTGAPVTVTANGNALANKIMVVDFSGGFSPASTRLFGLEGNDRLTGGGGRDSLDGGVGNDTMIGGLGSDTYTVNSLTDVVSDAIVFPVPNSDVDTLIFAVSTASTVSLGGTVSGQAVTKTYSGIEALTLGTATSALLHNGIGNDAANAITGNAAANRLYGLNGNDTLKGGAGNDQLFGGSGSDTIVLGSRSGSDRVADFKVSGSDKVLIDQSDVGGIGDGNTSVLGAVAVAGPGGFSKAAELVIVTGNIAGAITTASSAVKIGSATTGGAYAINDDRIFVVDNGTDSAVFLFTAKDADAAVEANELILLATLAGTASTVTTDFLFGA
jgi:Ca2+-binding RTX toxin-like protein